MKPSKTKLFLCLYLSALLCLGALVGLCLYAPGLVVAFFLLAFVAGLVVILMRDLGLFEDV